jgi:hypothetical protein
MNTVEKALRSRSFRRYAFRFFGRPFLISIALPCFVVVFWHILLGRKSPGLVVISEIVLRFWAELSLVVVFLVPSTMALFFIRKTAKRARLHGLTWYEFLDLSPEERNKLT